jgi:hypothetical protein
MIVKIAACAALAFLVAPAFADVAIPTATVEPMEYPVCTVKVTDKCIEKRAVAKEAVPKAAKGKLVRRDKAHRRKG